MDESDVVERRSSHDGKRREPEVNTQHMGHETDDADRCGWRCWQVSSHLCATGIPEVIKEGYGGSSSGRSSCRGTYT